MNIHFIGIGGIGLSALARFLKANGHRVSGSDIKKTSITNSLESENIEVTAPHSENIITKEIDLVIYSAVIKEENVELKRARELNIESLSRSEALKFILKEKRVFSVCGAHGKSTTTAILSSIIKESSSIIGAESKDFKSNFRDNRGDIVCFEADESDASFLNSNPYYAIVTNAEPEHMEFYNYDFKKFYDCYEKFLKIAKKRVINAEDEFLSKLDIDAIRLYPSRDIKNQKYILIDDEPYTRFTLKDLGEFDIWGFGEHIAIDCSLAILASLEELELEEIRENLKSYKGIKKRFDILQKNKNLVLIDDYGHHPTEIKATIDSAKIYAELKNLDKIVVIWQPHKYSRTLDNLEKFIECFKQSDRLIILPVWEAGEKRVEIDFKRLFSRYNLDFADKVSVKNGSIFLEKDGIEEITSGLVIGFGAGDITYQLRGLI